MEYDIHDVKSCSRCGKDHKAVLFWVLLKAHGDDNHPYTHWGFCEETHQPILMFHVKDDISWFDSV